MKRTLSFVMLLGLPLIIMAAISWHTQSGSTTGASYLLPLNVDGSPTAKATQGRGPNKTVMRDNYLFEDFETVDDSTGLPQGWVTVSTPGKPSDKWAAGRLNVNAVSGFNCAYVLGGEFETDHDTWLFSPMVHITDSNLVVDAQLYMPHISDGTYVSKISVVLCSSQSKNDVVLTLEKDLQEDIDYWHQLYYELGNIAPGDYCLGFHCSSPSRANTMCLDNVRISDGKDPRVSYDSSVDFGKVDPLLATTKKIEVLNSGTSRLKIWYKDSSPEITCTGLPLELGEWESGGIEIKLKGISEGAYEGFLKLGTNDVTQPEVTIPIHAEGVKYPVSDVIIEGFENGQPSGWDQSRLTFVLKEYGAHSGTMAWYSTASYANPTQDLPGMGFKTNYVKLGENPNISFWFKAYSNSGAADVNQMTATVRVSNDEGEWDEIWSIGPDKTDSISITGDWQQFKLQLPEKYKGKTARVCIAFYSKESYDYNLLIDDVLIGTPPANDAALAILHGPTMANPGKEQTYTVEVVNNSETDIEGGKIIVSDDFTGDELTQVNCPKLAGHATTPVEVKWTPEREGAYRLIATYHNDGDSNEANNTSSQLNIVVLPKDNRSIIDNKGKEWTGGMKLPVDFNSYECINQTIYRANDIGSNKGTINSIAYLTVLKTPYYSDNFKLYVAETDKDDLSDGVFIPDSAFVKVFDGNIYFPVGTNTMVIPFQKPYDYKGGNLVVMTTRKSDSFMYGIYYKLWLSQDNSGTRSLSSSSLKPGQVFGNDNKVIDKIDAFPETLFNIVYGPVGELGGKITDKDGSPVKGAKVTVTGSKLSAVTDAEGQYEISGVAAGDVSVTVTAHGYRDATSAVSAVSDGGKTTINVSLEAYPKYTVKGKFINDEGTGISNVAITLKGYDNLSAITDTNGNYTIPGVTGQTGVEYVLTAEQPYFHIYHNQISVNADLSKDFELDYKAGKPQQPTAIVSNDQKSCSVSWGIPLVEYSYDSGIAKNFVGWENAGEQIGAGACFKQNSEINEVSFYVGSAPAGHSKFNVYIFGLLPDGTPNKNNILFTAKDIPYVDDAWTTYKLPYKVKADGFMVFITCDGFINIGVSEPTGECPFAPGQCYYAGDGFSVQFSDMQTYGNLHFMIRAYGKDLGAWKGSELSRGPVSEDFAGRKSATYDVYRLTYEYNKIEAEKVASVSDTKWTDAGYAELEPGRYSYSVVAKYGNKKSIESISQIIDKTSTSVFNVNSADAGVSIEGDDLVLSCPEFIEEVTIANVSGVILVNTHSPEARISLRDMGKGVLIVNVKNNNGKNTVFKVVR